MSKELYLLRHAKSSWDDPGHSDRERPLNKRGRRNAPAMGRELAQRMPAMAAHVSPALRAQMTLGGLQDGWPELQGSDHQTHEALYTFSAGDLVHYIAGQHDTLDSLFLIGHNPALTDLVNWICGEALLANLPTAGFAHLRLACDRWGELDRGCGRLHSRLFPRELNND